MSEAVDAGYDVVVVGAGPAGSATAFFAARAGLRTLVLERARFPRDKTCGDGVGAGGVAVLREMGVYDDLVAAGAGQATGFGVTSPSGESFRHAGIVFESSLRPAPLLIAPRALLDESCARAAQAAGAALREDTMVRELVQGHGRAAGVRLSTGETLGARVVVGADGVHSRVARALGQHSRDPAHSAFALRVYYRGLSNVGSDAFFIYDERFLPAYFWVFPLPDGRANVGVGRFERYARADAPKLTALFDRFVEQNDFVRHLLEGGEPEGKLRGWPLRLGTSAGSGVADGALLVGDANGFIDPLTGEGIHFALRSGQLAAEVAVEALQADRVDAAQLGAYQRRWRAEFADEFRQANRGLDLLMSRSSLVDAVVDYARTERGFAIRLGEVLCGLRPKRDLIAPGTLARIGLRYLARRLRGDRPPYRFFEEEQGSV